MKAKRPILLVILDGWGLNDSDKGNAVKKANMEFVEWLKKEYPWVAAHASGEWVGLPQGQMGNSEVGHIHLGAGRINFESLVKLNHEVASHQIEQNPELMAAFEQVKAKNSVLHLLGLFSQGGVHSHLSHMFAIYQAAVKAGVKKIAFDLITDGRDTKPRVAKKDIEDLLKLLKQQKVGEITSISGRYYAMDRDKRFERTAQAYQALTSRQGVKSFTDPLEYLDQQYKLGRDDEMIEPAFNRQSNLGGVKKNDVIIMTNFRPDRAIQLASVFTNPNYLAWNHHSFKNLPFLGDSIRFVSLMKYGDSVTSDHIAYPPVPLNNTLGEYLANHGYKQLRIAETEKIAHVTFFFDGGKDYFKNGLAKPAEIKLKNAAIDLIPSPQVATYDLKPEMSAPEITDRLLEQIDKNEFDVIILNFANSDMVGHTGNEAATIKALKTLDTQLRRIYGDFVVKHNGIMIITADHGNAEIMIDSDGQPNKKHTTSLVPLIITDKNLVLRKENAAIADVAPTILHLLGEKIPKEMTQPSLIMNFKKRPLSNQ